MLCKCICSIHNVLESRFVVLNWTWWAMANAMQASKIISTVITICQIAEMCIRQVLLVPFPNCITNWLATNPGSCLIKYLVVQNPDFAVLTLKISTMESVIMEPKMIRNVTLTIRIVAIRMPIKKLKSVNTPKKQGKLTVKMLTIILANYATWKSAKIRRSPLKPRIQP